MKLSAFSVKRPITTLMITLIVVIFGIVSLSRLPIDLLPKIEIPIAVVSTTYRGAGPQEVEKLVTSPIEEAIATVANIENISSISSEGRSIVIAQFNFGTDMDSTALEMREKVDLIKSFLPEDASDPMVLKIDPNAQPIIQISLSGSQDLAALQNMAEDIIKPRLERLNGVASVDISGGYENQIEIQLYNEQVNGLGLSVDYIAKIIGAENLNLPGGKVQKGNQELTIRTMGEFQSIDEIKKLLIPLPTGGTVYLGDIADVEMNYKDVTTIAKTNGENCINISVQKQSGTNTVQVADRVNREIEKIKAEYENVHISALFDQSNYIKRSISTVSNNAIIGGILAILVLFLFLRNIRTTFIIGTAIPVSIIATFNLIYFSGITLNLMTLGGLALGIGMLVDNSIVVLENIYRFRQGGLSRIEAAKKGAAEVGMAVTASTLTTVAVFLPIVFIEGITSTIFKELAMTVTMSLAASLVVALTLVPMLSSKILKINKINKEKRKGLSRISGFFFKTFDKLFSAMERGYKKLLHSALHHRIITVIIAVVIFLGSIISVTFVGSEFFPSADEGQFTITVSLPEGAELKDTENVITEIESKLEDIEEIDTVFSWVGGGSMFSISGGNTNSGTIYCILKDLRNRDRSVKEVADQVRKLIYDLPGSEKKVEEMNSFSINMSGAPINIKIKGDELDTLKKLGEDFKDIIKSVEGTREVETNLTEGIPEVQVQINRDNAARYGLTAAQIASAIKANISGTIATRYKYKGDEIDIVIKGDEISTRSISDLEQLSIQTPAGINVPLNQLAYITIDRGPSAINREDQVRTVNVTAQIYGRDLGSISKDIERKLSEYAMPAGYTYEFGGENEEMTKAFSDLALALLLAIVLVYMILASQFESLLHPFTIMLSVPLGLSGGMLGLFVTGKALSIPAFIGIIMLAGIVVNNAIVLVDYIITRRKNGEDRTEAIMNAGPIRLRPVLMTTMTTVLGLIPLALGIGEGAELEAPLAIVVIFGLILSTLLTLVFIPIVYSIFDDLSNFIKKKLLRNKDALTEV